MPKYHNAPYRMNLQLFAEDGGGSAGDGKADGDGDAGDGDSGSGSKGDDDKGGTPTVDELLAKITALQAANERQKNSITKLTKANGDLTKLYREKLTEDEKAKLDNDDREAKYAEMEKRLATYEAKTRYLGLGMSNEMAEEVAGYEIAGDFTKMTEVMQKYMKVVKDSAVSEYVNHQKNPAGGNGRPDGKLSAAEELAKELAKESTRKTINNDALKKWAR